VVHLPWVNGLVSAKAFDALLKQPYEKTIPGKNHAGIKRTDTLCLKTMPTQDTPACWMPDNDYWNYRMVNRYREACSFAQKSLQLAKAAKTESDKILALPDLPYPSVVAHYGYFRVKPKDPWAKSGYLRPGVQLVMQRAPGTSCFDLDIKQDGTLFKTHTAAIKQQTGFVMKDRGPNNVFYCPKTQQVTHIDFV
jgi:hypothetical protein